MKYFVIVLAILLSCSTPSKNNETVNGDTANSDIKHNSKELTKPIDEEKHEPKTIEAKIISNKSTSIGLDSSYCNGNTLLYIHKNFNQLIKKDIDSFLKTFHKDCDNNIEFSEWSNELLYKVLDAYTIEVLDLLTSKNSNYEIETILLELESPINDGIMPKPLIDRINKLENQNELTEKVLKALQVAADRY